MHKIIDRVAKQREVTSAALELFLEKGYKSVTTREIAIKAGISKGILYHYFENKEDLFYQTVRDNLVETINIKAALQGKTLTPMDRFNNLKELCNSGIEQRRKRFRLMFDFIVYSTNKEHVSEVIGAIYGDTRAIVKQILSEAFPDLLSDPEKVDLYCNIITGYLDGIHFQNIFDPENASLEKSNELFWSMVESDLQPSTLELAKSADNA